MRDLEGGLQLEQRLLVAVNLREGGSKLLARTRGCERMDASVQMYERMCWFNSCQQHLDLGCCLRCRLRQRLWAEATPKSANPASHNWCHCICVPLQRLPCSCASWSSYLGARLRHPALWLCAHAARAPQHLAVQTPHGNELPLEARARRRKLSTS